MQDRFVLPDAENIVISAALADRLLKIKQGNAALVYLYILRHRGMVSDRKAAEDLALSPYEYERAMELLNREGLVRWTKQPVGQTPEQMPACTAADVQQEMENGTAFKQLAGEVERSLGRVLSADDLLKLFGIYDSLGLPPEVILVLITSCKEEIHRRYGDHRAPTMRYIEKAAYGWEQNGVTSLELAEEHLRRMDMLRNGVEEFRRVMQISAQPLTQRSREYLENWLTMGFSADAVEIAFERTVENTGKLAWKYMDSILRRWHEKSWHTADQIEKNDVYHPAPEAEKETGETTGPTAQELERMKRILREL